MHAREHVQIAAYLAVFAPNYLRQKGVHSPSALESFWIASKCRLDRWGIRLKTHTTLLETGSTADLPRFWNAARPVIEEILVSDILTRVWISTCVAYDRIHRKVAAEPVARSVFLGHMEARNRALNLLLHGRGLEATMMVPLNRLRRRTERWTDMLLGYIASETDVNSFGYDQSRVREFGSDIRGERNAMTRNATWTMLLESAVDAFGNQLVNEPANADLNRDIAGAVMSCFGADLFDQTTLINPMWEARIANLADDAELLVEQLLTVNEPIVKRPQCELPRISPMI
ncbi:hypothetical protein [Blastopirellula marina]|uniref:Uncharacterized protein n=1 Tax=Blastopirellula marina TaxID=124 RepID=A0A2S8FHA6_9BACT|nr:hypothetical protein [Blastopirellula marina]PQO31537.1 hypothetical protein C5Y98_19125 [Blastopirellula marina]PTL42843.1 hypothetical protein C5Y97_19135 [Blastopirellula marina]